MEIPTYTVSYIQWSWELQFLYSLVHFSIWYSLLNQCLDLINFVMCFASCPFLLASSSFLSLVSRLFFASLSVLLPLPTKQLKSDLSSHRISRPRGNSWNGISIKHEQTLFQTRKDRPGGWGNGIRLAKSPIADRCIAARTSPPLIPSSASHET